MIVRQFMEVGKRSLSGAGFKRIRLGVVQVRADDKLVSQHANDTEKITAVC